MCHCGMRLERLLFSWCFRGIHVDVFRKAANFQGQRQRVEERGDEPSRFPWHGVDWSALISMVFKKVCWAVTDGTRDTVRVTQTCRHAVPLNLLEDATLCTGGFLHVRKTKQESDREDARAFRWRLVLFVERVPRRCWCSAGKRVSFLQRAWIHQSVCLFAPNCTAVWE